MAEKRDHNSGFNQAVIPLQGKYKGKEILVSKFQKARLLAMKRVVLPGSIKAGKLDNKSEKEAKGREDK